MGPPLVWTLQVVAVETNHPATRPGGAVDRRQRPSHRHRSALDGQGDHDEALDHAAQHLSGGGPCADERRGRHHGKIRLGRSAPFHAPAYPKTGGEEWDTVDDWRVNVVYWYKYNMDYSG